MAWSWSFVPQRLFAEPAFLELDLVDRGVLLAAYTRCDKFGRGPAHPTALRACLSILDGHDVRSSFDRLASAGLLRIYSVGGREFWELTEYDEDSPAELLRRRGTASQFPSPPDDAPPPPGGGQTPPSLDARPPDEAAHPADSRQATYSERQATSGNAPPHARAGGDETRRDETRLDRSSQEGGAVAARTPAPAHPPARVQVPDVPPRDAPPEQARPAAPSSRPELALVTEPAWPTPTPPPTTWPPGTEEAGRAWWERLQRERPIGCGWTLADVIRLAGDYRVEFADAVRQHVDGVKGWTRTDPFAWLRRQCEFVREDRADKLARGRARGDQIPAVRQPREPFLGWGWRWDQVAADTPGLDAAWPSALDLPPEQHEALAWCTNTPDGPVEPPRRLAEVPGALDAYRAAHRPEAVA